MSFVYRMNIGPRYSTYHLIKYNISIMQSCEDIAKVKVSDRQINENMNLNISIVFIKSKGLIR